LGFEDFGAPQKVRRDGRSLLERLGRDIDGCAVLATAKAPRAAGARCLPGVVAIGGGVLVEAGGSILGAVAVSGAPGGEADDQCARAGLAAIADDIEF
jgi:uncharacterized protein GlcG (DUF336 family)